MAKGLRSKLNYSNAIATIALFLALGGAAVAAGIPKHSVGTKQLKAAAVTTFTIHPGAVTHRKLARGAVWASNLAANSVGAANLQNGSVNSAKLAKNSVSSQAITSGAVGASKLDNAAVTTAKLANGSVTPAKLGDEVAPLLGTLRAGQTLRGVFDVGGKEVAHGGVSYQFPLVNTPAATVLQKGETSANCGGLGGGNQQTPQATAGNLCIYITEISPETTLSAENNTRLGFGLKALHATGGEALAFGQWAVTGS